MLDVRRLLLLRDLADLGTVTAVADLHGVTPSAVSQQLRQLERETGAALVDRDRGRVLLTAAGAALVEDTCDVLAALERAEARLRGTGDAVAGPFRVSCFTSALPVLGAPLLAEARVRSPQLRLHLTEEEPETSLPLLRRRRCDLAVVYRYLNLGTVPPPDVLTTRLLVDPLLLVLPEGRAREAEGAVADLAAYADLPWVLAPDGSACREAALHACRSAGFTPDVRHTAADFPGAVALAAAGGAAALVPRSAVAAVAALPGGSAVRPLADPGLARVVEACVRTGTDTHPAVRACVRILAELGRRCGGGGAPADPPSGT
ncbi:LysR family transcriptional regulator [Streptomyces sp. NPDC001380]|uniref:LysR family transcriptional regulator n=1 Tax=Streptomyces sp. NPDC001380 TaxID=3364566 RepID=UPI0036AED100